MDTEIKKQWIEALRSDEYQQGQRWLRKKDPEGEMQYCCLGVLCDLMTRGEWEQVPHITSQKVYSFHIDDDRSTLGLPSGVVEVSGLAKDKTGDLVRLNDNERANFATIADWIEENL